MYFVKYRFWGRRGLAPQGCDCKCDGCRFDSHSGKLNILYFHFFTKERLFKWRNSTGHFVYETGKMKIFLLKSSLRVGIEPPTTEFTIILNYVYKTNNYVLQYSARMLSGRPRGLRVRERAQCLSAARPAALLLEGGRHRRQQLLVVLTEGRRFVVCLFVECYCFWISGFIPLNGEGKERLGT